MIRLRNWVLSIALLLPAQTLFAQTKDAGGPADAVMIEIRLIHFSPPADREAAPILKGVPLLSDFFKSADQSPRPQTSAEALASIAGVSLNGPVSDLFAERNVQVLTNRGGSLAELFAPYVRDQSKSGWQVLSAPRLLVLEGQEASVSVGQDVPFMTQRDDGSLIVSNDPAIVEGASIAVVVDEADDDSVSFKSIDVKLSRVVGRTPIPDVPFEVGRPIINTRETRMQLRIATNEVAVIALPQQDKSDAPILAFLTARPAKPDATRD